MAEGQTFTKKVILIWRFASLGGKNYMPPNSFSGGNPPPTPKTRGPKGHISCTWVQCAPFLTDQPGRLFLLIHRPEKHKLGRGRWDLASCQVLLNSIQRFHRRSRKCLSQSEDRAAILFFPIGPKNTNLVEDIEILLPVKFRLNSV